MGYNPDHSLPSSGLAGELDPSVSNSDGRHSKGTAGGGAGAQRRPPRGGVVSRGAEGRSQGDPQPTQLHPGTHCFLRGPCQHLVTFSLGEDAIHTVEDASQKLALMDSQGRIWAQDMLLRVSPSHVTLLDPASKVPRGARVEGTAALGTSGGVAPSLSLTSSSVTPTPGGRRGLP